MVSTPSRLSEASQQARTYAGLPSTPRNSPFAPRARGQGFNAILRTTHRQNFLVPPRHARAFPLSELKG